MSIAGKKFLGIDYGLKKIGISISDDTGTIAFPLRYISNNSFKSIFENLINIILDENVGVVVVGMPLGLKGKQTELSMETSKFIGKFQSNISTYRDKNPGEAERLGDIKVVTYDERFSTMQAQKSLISLNVKRKKRKEVVDSVASTLVLQSYLDKYKNNIKAD